MRNVKTWDELKEAKQANEDIIVLDNPDFARTVLRRFRFIKFGIPVFGAIVAACITVPLARNGRFIEILTAVFGPIIVAIGVYFAAAFFRDYELVVINKNGVKEIRLESTSWS